MTEDFSYIYLAHFCIRILAFACHIYFKLETVVELLHISWQYQTNNEAYKNCILYKYNEYKICNNDRSSIVNKEYHCANSLDSTEDIEIERSLAFWFPLVRYILVRGAVFADSLVSDSWLGFFCRFEAKINLSYRIVIKSANTKLTWRLRRRRSYCLTLTFLRRWWSSSIVHNLLYIHVLVDLSVETHFFEILTY